MQKNVVKFILRFKMLERQKVNDDFTSTTSINITVGFVNVYMIYEL